jgi:predicted nucleic acid-binding protein
MLSAQVFCDTSFYFAALNTSDRNHGQAKEFLSANKQLSLVTTWDVVSETVTLLRYRIGYATARQFLEKVKPHIELVHYDDSVREEAERIFKKFAKDKKLSFCDCISFVVLTEILPDTPILTFDRDFKQFGLPLALV